MERKIIKKFVIELKNELKSQVKNPCDLYTCFNKILAENYIKQNGLNEIEPYLKEKLPFIFNKRKLKINVKVPELKNIEIFDLCFQYYNFDEKDYFRKTQFYTPKILAQKICEKNLSKNIKTILEPACGSGVFLREIFNSSLKYNQTFKIDSFELDKRAIQLAQISYTINCYEKTKKKCFIEIQNKDFLLTNINKKYDFVLANPPFISRKEMPKYYMEYLKNNFDSSKENLAYGFLMKSLNLIKKNKNITFIIPDNFLYLKNTQEFKNFLFEQYEITTTKIDNKIFQDISGSKLSTSIFEIKNSLPQKNNQNKIKYKKLEDISTIVTGIQTGNNEKYVKHFSLIPNKEKAKTITQKNKKWYPYLKGGGYKKWSGNDEYYIFFDDNGKELRKEKKSIIRNEKYFVLDGITYSYYSENRFSARYKEKGTLFDIGGSCLFFKNNDDLFYTLGFLNSNVCYTLLNKMNPTMSFQTSTLKNIPLIIENKNEVIKLVKKCLTTSKKLDKFFITSKSFEKPDFTKNKNISLKNDFIKSEEKYYKLKQNLEEYEDKINIIFEKMYKLENIDFYKPKKKTKKQTRKQMIFTFLKWLNKKNYDEFLFYMKKNYPKTYKSDIEFILRIINGKQFKKEEELLNKTLKTMNI